MFPVIHCYSIKQIIKYINKMKVLLSPNVYLSFSEVCHMHLDKCIIVVEWEKMDRGNTEERTIMCRRISLFITMPPFDLTMYVEYEVIHCHIIFLTESVIF